MPHSVLRLLLGACTDLHGGAASGGRAGGDSGEIDRASASGTSGCGASTAAAAAAGTAVQLFSPSLQRPPPPPPHLQLLVQLAPRGVLEDQVDAGGVVKVAVEAQDVGVPQVALDLYLPPQLVLHVGLLQLVLEQHLQWAVGSGRVGRGMSACAEAEKPPPAAPPNRVHPPLFLDSHTHRNSHTLRATMYLLLRSLAR